MSIFYTKERNLNNILQNLGLDLLLCQGSSNYKNIYNMMMSTPHGNKDFGRENFLLWQGICTFGNFQELSYFIIAAIIIFIRGDRMDTETIIKRRQFVVDPKFQYGLIMKFTALVIIILISSLILLTFIYNEFVNNLLPVSLGTGGDAALDIANLVNLSDLIGPVILVIFLSVTISCVTVFVLGVRFTHRVAGPVNRLRSNIAEMADGDLGKKVSIREKDYFQSLALEIDRLREQWYKSVTELKTINRQFNDISNEEQKELLDRSDTILSDLLKTVS